MNFGEALEALKEGKKVARKGWNGNIYQKPPMKVERPANMDERIVYDSDKDLTFIKTPTGVIGVADGIMYEKLKVCLWHSRPDGYIMHWVNPTDNVKSTSEGMEDFICGAPPEGHIIDHINGDRSDNRLCNLRIATHQQNMANKCSMKQSSSKYKGVTWDKSRNKWIAAIEFNGKTHHLGRYDSEEDAAKAYDKEAWLIHGNYAKLNFPDEELPMRMYIYLTDGRELPEHEWVERSPAQATTITERMNGIVHIAPHIDMVSATGERVIGWLASQTDMLSDDWEVIM